MKNLKEIIKEGYKNLNYNFLSFIKDIKNIKDIGFRVLWERNKPKFIVIFISIIIMVVYMSINFT